MQGVGPFALQEPRTYGRIALWTTGNRVRSRDRPDRVTFDNTAPFIRAEALRDGVSPHAFRGPRFRRIFTGVYVAASVPDSVRLRARAALLLHPEGAWLSHRTAARLQGLPLPGQKGDIGLDDPVEVSVRSRSDRRRQAGIVTHVDGSGAATRIKGLPMSCGSRLFIEMAHELPLVDLVILGDAMVAHEMVTPEGLVEAVDRAPRSPAVAARAAALVRAGVDSPMETRARLLIIEAGLPEPTVDHRIRDETGHPFMRIDLSYPALRIAIEYDGQHHRTDLDQWDTDIDRRAWYAAHGWILIELVARDVFRRPAITARRVEQALRQRGVEV